MRKVPIDVRLEQLSIPEPNSGCTLWTGALTKSGYAQVGLGRGCARAHKVAYELAYGPVPPGLVLDHLCRVRCCINPDHLEPVTHAENVRRGLKNVSVCKSGHEFTPMNTVNGIRKTTGAPFRQCRTCQERRRAEYRARQSAASA